MASSSSQSRVLSAVAGCPPLHGFLKAALVGAPHAPSSSSANLPNNARNQGGDVGGQPVEPPSCPNPAGSPKTSMGSETELKAYSPKQDASSKHFTQIDVARFEEIVLAACPPRVREKGVNDCRVQASLVVGDGDDAYVVTFPTNSPYLYPASTTKLLTCVAALRRLASLRKKLGADVTLDTPIVVHPHALRVGDRGAKHDVADEDAMRRTRAQYLPWTRRRLTVRLLIQRVAVHSDNRANNVLMDLAGGAHALADAARSCKLDETRVVHRLSPSARVEGEPTVSNADEHAPAVTYYASTGAFTTPPVSPPPVRGVSEEPQPLLIGSAHVTSEGLVEQPMDFAKRNHSPLSEMQQLLRLVCAGKVPGVDTHDLQVLVHALACAPQDASRLNFPLNRRVYFDDWNKLFAPGVARVLAGSSDVQLHGKLGQAYGFTLENSRIAHILTGRAYYLAAGIYTNENGVLNDDAYEYDEAEAFLDNLAEFVTRALWTVETKCVLGLADDLASLRVDVVLDVPAP